MSTFFLRWNEFVRGVAGKLGPVLRPYGWDAEDAAQTASMKLLRIAENPRFLVMDETCLKRYLPKVIRRVVLRTAAGKRRLVMRAEDQVLALADDKGAAWVAEQLTDALADAPPAVARYFAEVVVAGGEWTGTNRSRLAAARWLERRFA